MTTEKIYSNQQLEEEDTCPEFVSHSYQINDYQWLSNSVIEIQYVCEGEGCHKIKYLYHYMERDDFIGL